MLSGRFGRLCRPLGLTVLMVLALQGCAVAVRAPTRMDSLYAAGRVESLASGYWRYLQATRPEVAVWADAVVSTIPDPGQDRIKLDAQAARDALVAIDDVRIDLLTEEDYVTWQVLRWELEATAGGSAFHWTQLSDLAPGRSVFERTIAILESQKVANAPAAQRYVNMVGAVRDVARTLETEYRERARRDIRLSRDAALRAITLVRSLIGQPDTSPFGLPHGFHVSTDTAWQVEFRDAIDSAVVKGVNPSLESLATFLESDLPNAPAEPGLSRLPGGAAHYASLLRFHSTIDVTPADAHAIGLREVLRIAALAVAARQAAGLPVSRDSLRAALARDPMFVVDDRVSIPELAARLFEDAKSLEPFFGPLPAMPLSIGIMPPVAEATAPLAIYEPATLTRPSARYVLNTSQLEARSALTLPALVLSDLVPGKHLQYGTQLENGNLPAFRRLAMHDGFVAGWRMYALDVADSLSSTLTPWQRFGVRMHQLAAACGLVVDTGINAVGWSRADALGFLRAYLPMDDIDLEREFIIEATDAPGTLSAATLGARELRGLRQWATRELGDRFTLAAFHGELLRTGSVPLPVLGAHLERWIWDLKHPKPVTTPPPPSPAGR